MPVQIYHHLQLPRFVRQQWTYGLLRSPSHKTPISVQCPFPPSRSARDPSSSAAAAAPTLLHEQVLCADSDSEDEDGNDGENEASGTSPSPESLLVVRRPVKDTAGEETDESGDRASMIEAGLNEFAKKMPIFEPLERVRDGREERPLGVNLELWLYRAKVLTREFQCREAEKILRKCIFFWPEDGRGYVALGKLLSKQSKFAEARSVYEKGSQATQGENPYIWQCWAVLEKRTGNFRRARELFDAATVADKKHVAAWHGWAVLEIKQGNIKKARKLLGKGLKYCGANEYIYQTLALLESKAKRKEQARFFFNQATQCNPKSCASWLAWAQVEMQEENDQAARQLFQKAVQASPKNRFAWHVWAIFEANLGYTEKGRKLLKIGHALNPKDPVILQSLALLEYKHSSANLSRVLFKRASELDPKHQPVWAAWGWMEWKEGNISTARELYQKTLSIDSTSESAARCLQAWGVLEQRLGNLTAARRLFRSSLNINSQSFVTWMTWASLEENQGNVVRAEEIRNLYFQQRTEVVDDASWVMGFSDLIDPAIASIRKLLNIDQISAPPVANASEDGHSGESSEQSSVRAQGGKEPIDPPEPEGDFDLDAFIREKLSLDASELDSILEMSVVKKMRPSGRTWWRPERKYSPARP